MDASEKHVSFVDDVRQNGLAESLLGKEEGCSDHAMGDILSGWRYDLSGVSPELIGAYQGHLHECGHCRARQRLHRGVDLVLISLFTVSSLACLLATMIIHRGPLAQRTFTLLHMHHLSLAITMQQVSVAGLVLSLIMWILVAIATPVPGFISHTLHERFTDDRDRVY